MRGCGLLRVTLNPLTSVQGTLTAIQTISLLPADYSGKSHGAEITVHENGQFVYASNRGHNSIVVYACDPETGLLEAKQWCTADGDINIPRMISIDLSGKLMIVANQQSDSLTVLSIADNGLLQRLRTVATTPKPTFVKTPNCI